MKWTFIICTHNPNQERIDASLLSIDDLEIPEYEVIVIGGNRNKKTWNNENIKFVDFDEDTRPGWITRKKNIAAGMAKYDNLCILHDYFAFDYEWYTGWLKFEKEGHSWNVACTPVKLINGARGWTDWITWDDPIYKKSKCFPYEDWSRNKYQYVSGGYFCIKKDFFLKNLLSEELGSHEHEDIEWSLRIRNEWKLVCNYYSIVRHTKWHRDMRAWRKHDKNLIKVKKKKDE